MGNSNEIEIGYINIMISRIGLKTVEQKVFRILTSNGEKSKDLKSVLIN